MRRTRRRLIGPAGAQATAPTILAEIDVANNGTNYITGATFAKYQISRVTAARDIARDVIYQTNSDCPAYAGDCGTYEDRVRFGIAKFQDSAHGGFVAAEIDAYSTNRTALQSAINVPRRPTSTPLGRDALQALHVLHVAQRRPIARMARTGRRSSPPTPIG